MGSSPLPTPVTGSNNRLSRTSEIKRHDIGSGLAGTGRSGEEGRTVFSESARHDFGRDGPWPSGAGATTGATTDEEHGGRGRRERGTGGAASRGGTSVRDRIRDWQRSNSSESTPSASRRDATGQQKYAGGKLRNEYVADERAVARRAGGVNHGDNSRPPPMEHASSADVVASAAGSQHQPLFRTLPSDVKTAPVASGAPLTKTQAGTGIGPIDAATGVLFPSPVNSGFGDAASSGDLEAGEDDGRVSPRLWQSLPREAFLREGGAITDGIAGACGPPAAATNNSEDSAIERGGAVKFQESRAANVTGTFQH